MVGRGDFHAIRRGTRRLGRPVDRTRLISRAPEHPRHCGEHAGPHRPLDPCVLRQRHLSQRRQDEQIQERRAEDAAELHDRERRQQFAARLLSRQHDRHEAEDGRQRRHDDRHHALERPLANRLFQRSSVFQAFAIAVEQQDSVAQHEAHDRHEADERRDGKHGIRNRHGHHAADQPQRHVDERQQGGPYALERDQQDDEDDGDEADAQQGQSTGRAFARLGAPAEGDRTAMSAGNRLE